MKHFKDKNNKTHSFDEDIKQETLETYIEERGLTSITEEEMKTLTYVEPVINPKYEGEVYTLNDVDYKVSFMKDDADGLMQVSMAFQLGLTETVIYFENGTKMPIKNTEFEAFAIWFVGKRNSFFVGGTDE